MGPALDGRGWRAAWEPVHAVELDTALLQARKNLPVQVMETLRPTLLHTPTGTGCWTSGRTPPAACASGGQWPAGTELRLQTGEVLDKEGNLYRENLRATLSEQVYISDGQPCDYAPTFTFFGFRYARVQGLRR